MECGHSLITVKKEAIRLDGPRVESLLQRYNVPTTALTRVTPMVMEPPTTELNDESGDRDAMLEALKHAGEKRPLFRNLDEEPEITVVESLCLSCYEQGTTKFLLTRIPFFKEIVLSSFECSHCGNKNCEIQSAGRVQDKGCRITLLVADTKDLNRQLVKSEYAAVHVPLLQFEIPPKKGQLTTIEGLLVTACDDLQHVKEQLTPTDPEGAAKIGEFVSRLRDFLLVPKPFELILDDPSGNSFIENPLAPAKDDQLAVLHYARTRDQDVQLCLALPSDEAPAEDGCEVKVDGDGSGADASAEAASGDSAGAPPAGGWQDEVLNFASNCNNCNSPCETKMKLVDIPYFKQIVLMALNCEACGFRDNEVKGATGIEEKGTRITLHITEPSDLSRDVLKSDTAAVSIPELELCLEEGTLGGKFTTLEGLLVNIRDQLKIHVPFALGDSATDASKAKMEALLTALTDIAEGRRLGDHFVLDDPSGNSYLQNVYAPDPDPEMTVEHYERSFDQNELLGLNDMQTENYEETEHSAAAQ